MAVCRAYGFPVESDRHAPVFRWLDTSRVVDFASPLICNLCPGLYLFPY
jgi:hypothetical protein